ncbi:hypothetical protein [Algoriphagus algorifonticola]|uniref:hypothetical protein n=1 Tax=Algoriphagus algorifonticola TaxID=2593007 RepID=UPI0011A55121|nr:hypothetical protein [Algoriphagus algorifonticola]
MQQYFLLGAFLFAMWSCKPSVEESALPELLELTIIDSTLTGNELFFINVNDQVQIIGDSLIAISSIRTPLVGILRKDGKQVGQIASGDFPIGAFSPASFDISDYPIIYILDKRSESVLVFDVQKQEFNRKVKLNLPEDKIIRTVGAKFKKTPSGFMAELYSLKHDGFLPEFYQDSGNLIYFFDSTGKIQKSILDYPQEYAEKKGSLRPINYLAISDNADGLLVSFPHTKKLKRFTINGEEIEEIQLPNSRFFDYILKESDRIIDFQGLKSGQNLGVPSNDYFNSIFEDKKSIYIETWMKIDTTSMDKTRLTHLMIYNKKEEKWYETQNPKGILDIGMLAGVVRDTLYFYEGSMMKYDDKYIKRAVLRPVDD